MSISVYRGKITLFSFAHYPGHHDTPINVLVHMQILRDEICKESILDELQDRGEFIFSFKVCPHTRWSKYCWPDCQYIPSTTQYYVQYSAQRVQLRV